MKNQIDKFSKSKNNPKSTLKFDFSNYISPFTHRYGSKEMQKIFSEEYKYRLWRKIWVCLAQVEYECGLLNKKELQDLEKNESNLEIERILEIEKETKHDVVAAIKEFAEKAKIGGGKIHLGATSMDIVDNADGLRIREALGIIKNRLITVIQSFSTLIKKYADFPCIGYTHLQPAEPTTLGYRMSFYTQDLLISLEQINQCLQTVKGKGIKGAVGTSASFTQLLNDNKMTVEQFESKVMQKIGLDPVLISTQTYPRLFDFLVLNSLAVTAAAISKFAADLRIMQSPNFGEWSEPFSKKQVGSSAMPFKKNPIKSENICSLARFVSNLPKIAWENASLSYLERTLDDSANKRIVMAEAFIACEHILITAYDIISGLVINEPRITYNLKQYAPFAATEAILIACVKKGANRQDMHESLRTISLTAWSEIQQGKPNPMETLLLNNPQIKKYLKVSEIKKLLDIKNHIDNAPQRALQLVKQIRHEE